MLAFLTGSLFAVVAITFTLSLRGLKMNHLNLSKNFGGLSAVEGVDLSIDEAEKAVGIIGPNGSGKTTFFNMLTGFFLPSRGQILFQGEDITRFAPNRRVLKGIARTFQLVSVFDRLTPWENLVLSSIRFEQEHQSLFRFMLKSARNRSTLDVCFDMLALMGLEKVAETKTSELCCWTSPWPV